MKKEIIVNVEIEFLIVIKNVDVLVLEKMLYDDLLFNLLDGNIIIKEFDLNLYCLGKMKIDLLEVLG